MTLSSVLVAVRGDKCDDEVVRLACELLNSNKGMLYILHVIEVERGLPVDAEIDLATARGEEVLNHLEGVAGRYKCRTKAELIQARHAGSGVVQEAVVKGVDSIVLGLPFRERYGSFSLGETVPYVLKNAPCKVILWRDTMLETQPPGSVAGTLNSPVSG
jgi:nucleotide-binding universal stress UspA family protein